MAARLGQESVAQPGYSTPAFSQNSAAECMLKLYRSLPFPVLYCTNDKLLFTVCAMYCCEITSWRNCEVTELSQQLQQVSYCQPIDTNHW